MKKIYLLASMMLMLVSLHSQVQTNYNAKWFIGFNTGLTWHTTDVGNQINGGWGLTFGRSFNYNYGRIASLDVRARFLHGWWYGQDTDTTDFTFANQTLSTDPTNYKDSAGFMVNNFQTEVYRASVELVLHLNRIRERTRWDPYIFGGIGLTWHQTYGDLLVYDTISYGQNLYQYDPNLLTKSSLRNLKDGVYETALDGSEQNRFNIDVMPSLGFGLGYQLGKGTTIGFEHKSTFTGLDTYDGFAQSGKYAQDIYHYSNLYIQFRLGRSKQEKEESQNYPPDVEFLPEGMRFKEVPDSVITLQAKALRVFNRENLTFTQDGQLNNQFYFSEKSERFSAQVSLKPGLNTFVLIGSNVYGQDADTIQIQYKRVINNFQTGNPNQEPVQQLPIVNFQQPSAAQTTVNNPVYNVQATVLNVTGRNKITVTFNGVDFQNFTYNASSKVVQFQVQLNLGSNEIRVKGVNDFGQDEEVVYVVYQRVQTVQPPTVDIFEPAQSPHTQTTPNALLQARVLNISQANQIQFKVNGSLNGNFSFNPSNGLFSANVVLLPGNNLFEVAANNEGGTANDQAIIRYERSAPQPPIVSITHPAQSNSVSSTSGYQFTGSVLNVTNKNQVTLVLNGQFITNFSFNATNGNVIAAIQLQTGNNTVVLSGQNNDGSDSKSAVLVYRPSSTVQPPVVNFVSPSSHNTQVTVSNYQIEATIANVAAASGVNVTVNGSPQSNFTYQNGVLSFNQSLVMGANVITVKGTNTAGSDEKSVTIFYRKPAAEPVPVVTFLEPNQPQSNSNIPDVDVIARVEHVTQKSQVQVFMNGVATSNFLWNATNNRVTLTAELVEGSNIIRVVGTNAEGSDDESILITYRAPRGNPPVVDITQPQQTPFEVGTATYLVQADLVHVASVQNIVVQVNGQNISQYNFNSTTGKLEWTASLQEGSNFIRIAANNAYGTAEDEVVIIYKKKAAEPAPKIVYVQPNAPGQSVSVNTYMLEAKVFHVQQKQNIEFRLNGQLVADQNWSFNVSTSVLKASVALLEGNNIFDISAHNNGGSDHQLTNLTYERKAEPCDRPKVQFISPANASISVVASRFILQADVTGVTNSADLLLKLNGVEINATNWTNNRLSAMLTLMPGNNTIEILAKNNCGTVLFSTSVQFQEEQKPCEKPTFNWLSPRANFSRTTQNKMDIRLGVNHIDRKDAISLTVNGKAVVFGYDLATHLLEAQLSLQEGSNTIEVSASNLCGVGKTEWVINRVPCEAPSAALTYASIADKTSSSERRLQLQYQVSGIQSTNQIAATLNNKGIGFNWANGILSFDQELAPGVHSIRFVLTNDCGTKELNHNVTILKNNEEPPTVQFLAPVQPGSEVDNRNFQVILQTTFVNSASEVLFKLNGNTIPITFNSSEQKATANVVLVAGNNVLEVNAVNSAGSSTASSSVIYTVQKTQSVQKPVLVLDGPKDTRKVKAGTQSVTGRVLNISSASDVKVKVNGKLLPRVGIRQSGEEWILSVPVVVTNSQPRQIVEIVATNVAGEDKQTVILELERSKGATPNREEREGGVNRPPTRGGR